MENKEEVKDKNSANNFNINISEQPPQKEIVLRKVIEKREKGYLYYLDKDCNLCRCKKYYGGKKGALRPRPKTKEELRLINTNRKRVWRAKQRGEINNIN